LALEETKVPALSDATASPLIIDEVFNEVLFKLWMNGMSFNDIQKMFAGSPRAFSSKTFVRTRERYNWDERKAQIISELAHEVDDEIKFSRRKQLQLVQMVVDMNLKVIESEYAEFMHDPKAYIDAYKRLHKKLPPWLALDSYGMLELLKTHRFATDENFKPDEAADQRKTSLLLTPEEEAAIWKTMRIAATRKVLPTTTIEIIPDKKTNDDSIS